MTLDQIAAYIVQSYLDDGMTRAEILGHDDRTKGELVLSDSDREYAVKMSLVPVDFAELQSLVEKRVRAREGMMGLHPDAPACGFHYYDGGWHAQ